jgi:hypothetical protein
MMKFSLDRFLCIVVIIIIIILFVAGIDDNDDLCPLVQLIIDDLMTTQLLLPVL